MRWMHVEEKVKGKGAYVGGLPRCNTWMGKADMRMSVGYIRKVVPVLYHMKKHTNPHVPTKTDLGLPV